MRLNKKAKLAKNCSLLQKFAEELFANDKLRYVFVGSSQSVHRIIENKKFTELFSSTYWQKLMGVMSEIIAVTDQNTKNSEHKFLTSNHILLIKALPKEKLKILSDAYQAVKYLCS